MSSFVSGFIQHVFELHPRCSMYQDIISFDDHMISIMWMYHIVFFIPFDGQTPWTVASFWPLRIMLL